MRCVVGISVVLLVGVSSGATVSNAEPAAPLPVAEVSASTTKLANASPAKAAVASGDKVALATVPTAAKPKPKAPSLVARIDLRAQRMHVSAHGKPIASWSISSGKRGHETPPGRFRPQWSSRMHYSRKYNNSPMPYSVFFNRGIATHGTTYTGRLGSPASHGCIRLRTAHARKFYQLVHRHGYKRTRIIVTGRARQPRRTSRRRVARRNNAFGTTYRNAYGQRTRYSVNHYDRRRLARHRQRVQRYYQSRRMVFPGDRY